DQEKTEAPTPRRREDARKMGQVARSRELPSAAVLLGGVGFLFLMGGAMVKAMADIWSALIWRSGTTNLDDASILPLASWILWKGAMLAGPMVLCMAILAGASQVAQFGLLFSTESLTPKLSRISPVSGLRRLLSLQSLVELVKGLLKLAIVAYVAWRTIAEEWEGLLGLVGASPWVMGSRLGNLILRLGVRMGLLLLGLAILDYLYQRWEHERDLKMTREEVKEEYKQREGDPKVKGRLRQRQREMARSRMIAAVPKADVVIKNPEHLAVALRYDRERMAAPVVVAKGAGYLALRILEVAARHGVAVMEDRPLARALYKSVGLGEQIPVNLYKAVAEVLAHVYRERSMLRDPKQGPLKGKALGSKAAAQVHGV
ncbi:MAG: flagellar biosynthesis protein FlhB, partial [Thermodesulfobacteriota bacterium]